MVKEERRTGPARQPQSRKQVCIAIVADTHGYLDERVAAVVERCDVAVHAGDIMGCRVLERLRPQSGRVVAVRGNNDVAEKWPRDEHQTLLSLPEEAFLDLPGGSLVVVHGHRHWSPSLRHDRLRKAYADARAIVYGHSHRLACDQAQRPWVLNPGASGRARTFGGPSCLVLRAGLRHWGVAVHRFEPLRPEGTKRRV